ncbi:MAG: DUF721 domain-containing protein [Thermodesulfobacteriota bacterium]
MADEMSKPTSIRTLLHTLIATKGWEGRVAVHQVFLLWEELVGPDIARHAQPYLIRKDILWLRVSDSVWMQQLQFLKIMLLDKINGRLPKGRLADLRFQLDSSLGQESASEDEAARPGPLAPSPAERQEFERLLGEIADREIRAAIRRCWLATGRRRPGGESGQ